MDPRLQGIQPEHFELLRQVGIRRFEDLRSANSTSLYQWIANANAQLNLLPTEPTLEEVVEWISAAQRLSGELPEVEDDPRVEATEQESVAKGLTEHADKSDEVWRSGERVSEERRWGGSGDELPGEEELPGEDRKRDWSGQQEQQHVGEIPGEDRKRDW